MKTFQIFALLIALNLFSCETSTQNSTAETQTEIPQISKADRNKTLENFYGYEPEEILSMTIEDQKALVKKYNIKPADLIILKLNAQGAIYDKQSLKDSLETQRVYDRIERKLSN